MRSESFCEEAIEDLSVERFLVLEVVIEQRLVDGGGFGDSVHASAGQTFLPELHQGGPQDGLAGGLGLTASAAAGKTGFGGAGHRINRIVKI